jgi:hypothetical protein
LGNFFSGFENSITLTNLLSRALIALGKQLILQVKKTHDGNVNYEILKIERKQTGNR